MLREIAPLLLTSFLFGIYSSHTIKQCPAMAPLVNVTIYYESGCSGCQYFIHEDLLPVYHNLKDIMNLTMLPHGNSREKKVGDKYVYTCQNGKEECQGNLASSCVLHHYPNMTQVLSFIDCFEYFFKQFKYQRSLDLCAPSFGIDAHNISKCVTGDEGWKLQHQAALQTKKHAGVPWVLINGKHSEEYEWWLSESICDEYRGVTPPYCHVEK